MATQALNPPRSVALESRAIIPGPAAITAILIVAAAWYLNTAISWRQAALFLVGASLSKEALQKVGWRPLAHGVTLWIVLSGVALLLSGRG